MTREEVVEKFRDVEMHFVSYYKYTFKFKAEHDGYVIDARFGGESGEVYNFKVDVTQPVRFQKPENWSWVIISRDGQPVFEDWKME